MCSETHKILRLEEQGVIDTRDLLYYVSLIFLMLYLAHNALESRKWK